MCLGWGRRTCPLRRYDIWVAHEVVSSAVVNTMLCSSVSLPLSYSVGQCQCPHFVSSGQCSVLYYNKLIPCLVLDLLLLPWLVQDPQMLI